MIIAITVSQVIFQKIWDLHPDISLVTRNPTITHRSKFISLWPWSSRHEYQDYCHRGEPGYIKKIRYMTGWQDCSKQLRSSLKATCTSVGRLNRIRFSQYLLMPYLLLWLLPSRWTWPYFKITVDHSSSRHITGYKEPNHNTSQQIHQPWAMVN